MRNNERAQNLAALRTCGLCLSPFKRMDQLKSSGVIGYLSSILPSVCLHPALPILSLSLFYLSVRPPSGAAYQNSSHHLPQLYQTLFWHVLPHSLSVSTSTTFFISLLLETVYSPLPPPLLLIHPLRSQSMSHPPPCLSIRTVSKSLRGISDSLANCPLLHLKAGWLNFSCTFLQLSSNQYLLKH